MPLARALARALAPAAAEPALPVAQQDDFDRGVAKRRAVLGDAWVDQSLDRATEFNAEFQALITRYAWHDIWGRPDLDHETRRLLVLGMTMAAARWEEFELHCRATVRAGVPLAKVKETLMQGAIYCGVPAANTAFKITMGILRDEGLLPAPAPLTAGLRTSAHHTFSEPQLAVQVQGRAHADALPVALSHALGLDAGMWAGLADTLAARHTVLRYDHRGHGASAVPPGPCSMDDLVDDAARLLREWGRGPVLWVGVSMGGMVGQGLAIRHPELLCGLVLANTAAQYPADAAVAMRQRIARVEQHGVAAIADGSIERFFSADCRAAAPPVVEATRRTLLRTSPAGYVAACHAVMGVDWLARLGEVRCPTLVVSGSADMSTPPEAGRAIAERIPGARFVLMDGTAHLSALEQPAAFAELVQGFAHELGG